MAVRTLLKWGFRYFNTYYGETGHLEWNGCMPHRNDGYDIYRCFTCSYPLHVKYKIERDMLIENADLGWVKIDISTK